MENDKFILVEDLYQNSMVFRESEIKSMIDFKEFAEITFTDGHKCKVKTCVKNIWSQLAQNNKN